MNQQMAIEDYGYRDFLLIKAPRAQIEAAVAAHALENDMDLDFEVQPWRPGFLMRLVFRILGHGSRIDQAVAETQKVADAANAARDAAGPIETGPVSMHRGGDAATVDMTVTRGPAYGAAGGETFAPFLNDIRVSGLNGSDWILVEYKEQVSGMSMLGFVLSMKLPQTDVLYFRQSGARVSEAHYDFHLYRDGETSRRVLCHATWAEGDRAQEWWEGQADGEVTAFETDSLYAGATEATLLDNAKIEAILASLGLSPRTMFRPGAALDPVLYSRRAGGQALS